jgi:(S)-sulfolactate dehydrogenase
MAGELSIVGRLGAGLENIDVAACAARNITVVNAAGSDAVPVAEYVMGALLNMRRNVYGLSDEVAAGRWPRQTGAAGGELHAQRLGLIGFGHAARQTAQLARAFGMQVFAYDPAVAADAAIWGLHGARPSDLAMVLAESDVISVHVPLTDATRALLGARQIAQMKPGAFLINTAHGGVVDEAAVVSALKQGHLGGAAFDVFAQEPLLTGSVWADAPNVILTPHIAGITEQSSARMADVVARKILAHFDI